MVHFKFCLKTRLQYLTESRSSCFSVIIIFESQSLKKYFCITIFFKFSKLEKLKYNTMFTQFTCLRIPTAKTFPSSDCKETGRPVGWSRCHNPWTPILESYVINTKWQIADQSQWFEMKTVDRITFRIYFHFTSSVLPEYLQKTCCQ